MSSFTLQYVWLGFCLTLRFILEMTLMANFLRNLERSRVGRAGSSVTVRDLICPERFRSIVPYGRDRDPADLALALDIRVDRRIRVGIGRSQSRNQRMRQVFFDALRFPQQPKTLCGIRGSAVCSCIFL